jgi:hypothetical protein
MHSGSREAPSSLHRAREEARQVVEEVRRKLRAVAAFDTFVIRHGEEPDAAMSRADLRNFPKGAMACAFEKALEKLDVGDIGGPVEPPFEFHLILRTPQRGESAISGLRRRTGARVPRVNRGPPGQSSCRFGQRGVASPDAATGAAR